ncbi:MAG: hypothetical protein HOC91_00155 [Nitrospinaceae bacterium]|nr:hypothetical protein [Nitrospinaceae bacterium]MBT4428906.1 hypothetical protein [Nitrospinaceae bacterium]
MSEKDEVPGLEAIRKHRELWELGLIVPFVTDAKEDHEIVDDENGCTDISFGAISSVIRELGGRKYLDDVETPAELLEVIDYYKSFTNALSADEDFSQIVICTEFVSEVSKLYEKIIKDPAIDFNSYGAPINGERNGHYLAPGATRELDRFREKILQMDGSLSVKTEPIPYTPPDERVSSETTTEKHDENTFIKKGDFWTISFRKKDIGPIKHTVGLVYIHHLLQFPGKIVNAFELSNLNNQDTRSSPADLLNQTAASDRLNENITSDAFGNDGDAINYYTSKTINNRLRDLREEIVEAKENNDLGRVNKFSEEIQELENYLNSSIGLKGRPRKLNDIPEKARSAVSKAIHRAFSHLEPHSPELVAHLKKNIQTGFDCCYNPENKIDWTT